MSYYQQRGGGGALWFFMFIIVAILGLLMVARNPQFKTWLNSLLTPQQQQQQQQPQQPAPVTPPSDESTEGGGQISLDTTCPGGETCVSDNDGSRMECDAEKGDSYEATWCGSFSGDQLTIKLYGPGHGNDGNCCWCNIIVHEDGTFQTGGEGPHSPNTNCEHNRGGSIGGSSNICVKATIQPGPSGPTMIGYGLVDGQWKEMVRRTGECGCSETSNVKTGNQVAFRCDGGSFQTTCATVKPLEAGGITPAPTTPPASGGTEEEEDEPADEDEEEEDEDEDTTPSGGGGGGGTTTQTPPSGGGTPTGSSQGGCPARCAPLRNAPSSYQACCGSGGAGVARVAMRRAMYSSFQYNRDYGILGRRRRVGNLI